MRGIDVDEYVCLTVLSRPGEVESEFKGRLSAFWTAMLRSKPDEFAKVYAEAARFENHDGCLARRYLVESEVANGLCEELARGGLAFLPVDPDDVYSKYEAAPPEWFWIEH